MAQLTEYLWIAVCGGIMGFVYGFLIGANDVANAFASSVSAKSVTLKQAVIIASIFEFCGAFFLGASVTSTIRSKIVDTDLFTDEPDVLMFGMFTALIGANTMLFIATYFGLPVSTTHDIVGSVMGFSIAAKGFGSIQWDVAIKIFTSWIVSPILSGAVSSVIFGCIKFGVLRSENPYKRAYWTFPIVITVFVGIDLFYILYKAGSNFSDFVDNLSLAVVLPSSFGAGVVLGLIWVFFLGPIAKRRVEALGLQSESGTGTAKPSAHDEEDDVLDLDELYEKSHAPEIEFTGGRAHQDEYAEETEATDGANQKEESAIIASIAGKDSNVENEETGRGATKAPNALQRAAKKFGDSTYNQDLHTQSMHENHRAQEIWDECEKFDPNAEQLFTYLQVLTACLNSFAHGANDVSNTIAPLSAIINIYQTGVVDSKSTVQKWVLAYGGIAIVLGLLLFGYRVMKTIGFKLTMMSPSRGASAELAASLVVVTASFVSIPVSSTQCIVGAVSGVGLVGGRKNVQWFMLLRVCVSWAFLFVIATILTAGIFSFAYYSPN